MSIRNNRLSSNLKNVIQLAGVNDSEGQLSDLTETIDRTLSFSEQKDLITSGTKTLAEGIRELLDTNELGSVGEAILGNYASNTEAELLTTLSSLSSEMLQNLDSMANAIQGKVANKLIPLSSLVDGYKRVETIYSTAVSAFLSVETLLNVKSIDEVLDQLTDMSDDSWYKELVAWSGLSLLNKSDYKSLSVLMDTLEFADYEVILEDIYISLLTHMTTTPKELGSVAAIGNILSSLNSKESSRLIRSLERFRPTREKLSKLATTFKSANVLTEVVDETEVTFRATDVIQAKLL